MNKESEPTDKPYSESALFDFLSVVIVLSGVLFAIFVGFYIGVNSKEVTKKTQPNQRDLVSPMRGLVSPMQEYNNLRNSQFTNVNRIITGPARVTNVVDGDTIDVMMDLGLGTFRDIRIRLNRIDTPEKTSEDVEKKKKAMEATEFTKKHVLGKVVILQITKKDSFGRYITEVWHPDPPESLDNLNNLSDELLSAGLAELYKK